jgi:hypothetical protein
MPQQGYYREVPPQAPRPYGTRPYYGAPGAIPPGPAGSAEQDAIRQDTMRPPLPISPGQMGPGPADPRVTPSLRGGDPRDAWYHLGKQSELFSFHHAGEHVDACDVATGSARGRH